jgi:hypothetical protein
MTSVDPVCGWNEGRYGDGSMEIGVQGDDLLFFVLRAARCHLTRIQRSTFTGITTRTRIPSIMDTSGSVHIRSNGAVT